MDAVTEHQTLLSQLGCSGSSDTASSSMMLREHQLAAAALPSQCYPGQPPGQLKGQGQPCWLLAQLLQVSWQARAQWSI
jgi:hypothetical protein